MKLALKGVALVLLVVAVLVLKTMYNAGSFKELRPQSPGPCREVRGVLSSEDVVLHRATGTLFVSSADNRPRRDGRVAKTGAIVAFRSGQAEAAPVNLTPALDFDFSPHGISLHTTDDGDAVLFVVNHRRDGEVVEIFDVASDTLHHRASIRGALMTSPNDVAAVGERSFYVTNDHGRPRGLLRTVEEYGQLAWSYVLFYDGETFHRVVDGIGYANGVALSADRSILYVAGTIDGGVHLFDRDPGSGALTRRGFIDLDSGVDNLTVDSRGDLWVASHPKLLAYVAYSRGANPTAPSEVFRVRDPAGDHPAVERVLLDLGERLSASSVAVPVGSELAIGSVMDPRFIICDLGGGS